MNFFSKSQHGEEREQVGKMLSHLEKWVMLLYVNYIAFRYICCFLFSCSRYIFRSFHSQNFDQFLIEWRNQGSAHCSAKKKNNNNNNITMKMK